MEIAVAAALSLIFVAVMAIVAGTAVLVPSPPRLEQSTPVAPVAEPPSQGPQEAAEGAPAAAEPGHKAAPEPAPPEVPAATGSEGLLARMTTALARSRAVLAERFDTLFTGTPDESLFENLEETLLTADVGFPTTERLVARVREAAKADAQSDQLREALRDEIRTILTDVAAPLTAPETTPWVILVVGVNGSGKTTTIGKLAQRFANEGRSVLLAAADTYRAAASEQLGVWAERTGADFVSHTEGADPGAVVYDALEAAIARKRDVVLIDTAGRLQTKRPLMEQLGKIRRIIGKKVPDGPHETLLVVDGTMGQNAMSQATLFNEVTPLSAVAVTKLDGTAKGGMILTIAAEMKLPVKLIGIGEGVGDLKDFDVDAFVEVLA